MLFQVAAKSLLASSRGANNASSSSWRESRSMRPESCESKDAQSCEENVLAANKSVRNAVHIPNTWWRQAEMLTTARQHVTPLGEARGSGGRNEATAFYRRSSRGRCFHVNVQGFSQAGQVGLFLRSRGRLAHRPSETETPSRLETREYQDYSSR